MSKINYQALREVAEKAGKDKWQAKKIHGDFFVIRHGSYTRQHGYTMYQPIAEIDDKPVRDFVALANPATVLSLLDELKAKDKRITELAEENVALKDAVVAWSGRELADVTPETDAFLAEVRAQGVDALAQTLDGLIAVSVTRSYITEFAAQLRKGGTSE